MKKVLSIFILFLGITYCSVNYSQWAAYGTPGFTGDTTSWQNLAFRPINQEPHVAMRVKTGETRIWKHDGSSWLSYGGSDFPETDTKLHQLITSGNEMFVAYTSVSDSTIVVRSMSTPGSSWWAVSNNFGKNDYTSISLANNPNSSRPIIAYTGTLNNRTPVVSEFNGSSWVSYPSTGLSDSARRLDLQVTTNGIYLAYIKDTGSLKTAVVKKYNTTLSSWEDIGPIDGIFIGGNLQHISLGINPVNEELYLAYHTTPITAIKPLFCKWYDNASGNWLSIGASPINNYASNPKLRFHPITKELYLGAKQENSSQKNYVFRLENGTTWVGVDNNSMVGISAGFPSFNIKPSGELLIAFQAGGNSQKTTVNEFLCQTVNSDIISITGGDLKVSSSYKSYQWYYNGAAINGANDSIYTATSTGNYYCVLIGDYGCFNYSDTISWNTTSLNSIEKSALIRVFPNPSETGKFNFSSDIKPNKLTLFDYTGKQIKPSLLTNNYIDISNNPKGIYLLKIDNQVIKLIKN